MTAAARLERHDTCTKHVQYLSVTNRLGFSFCYVEKLPDPAATGCRHALLTDTCMFCFCFH
jgi:hypothetical protein